MSTSSPQRLPAFEVRVVWVVFIAQLVNVLDFMMVMPLGPDFAKGLGIAESQIGIVGGAYTGAAAISAIVLSRFLDRFDRRRALVISLVGLSLGTVCGGLAVNLETLVGARVLAGAFGGPATSLSLAIIADVVPFQRRGRAMGIVSSAFAVCAVLGVPAGLLLARLGSWHTPFFAVAGLGMIVSFAAHRWLPPLRGHLEGPRRGGRAADLLLRSEVAAVLVAAGILMISVFMIVPNLSAFLQHNLAFPRARLEVLYLVGGVASFAVVRITGVAVDRHGSTKIAALGTVCFLTAVSLGLLPTHPPLPVVVTFVLFMTTASLRMIPLQTLASRMPAPEQRALYMSAQSAIQHIAATLGAFIAAKVLTTDANHHLVGMPTVLWLSMGFAVTVPFLLGFAEARSRAAAGDQPTRT